MKNVKNMTSVLNLIIKEDYMIDNIISIYRENNDYQFNCSCGKYCCTHLDYIIYCLTNNMNKEHITIVGFTHAEYLDISFNNNNKFNHTIIIKFTQNKFFIDCSCNSINCEQRIHSINYLLNNYLYKKEKYSDLSLDNIENNMNNLKI